MNERAQKLLDLTRTRMFNDEDIRDLVILRTKLSELISFDEKEELNKAWIEMQREYELEKWDESFLRAVVKEDIVDESYEERMDNLFDSLKYKGANRYSLGTAGNTPFTTTVSGGGAGTAFTQGSLVEAVKAIQEEMKLRQQAELESAKAYYDECEEDK